MCENVFQWFPRKIMYGGHEITKKDPGIIFNNLNTKM